MRDRNDRLPRGPLLGAAASYGKVERRGSRCLVGPCVPFSLRALSKPIIPIKLRIFPRCRLGNGVRPEIVRRGLRLRSHGKVAADCGRMGSAALLPLVPVRHRSVRALPCDRSRRRPPSQS